MSAIDWGRRAGTLEILIRDFIDGHYLERAAGDKLINKHSPRDGALLYQVAQGDAADVECAVVSAKYAFDDGRWRDLPIFQRRAALHRLADLVESNKDELALYESLDVGKPITQALNEDIAIVVHHLRSSADMLEQVRAPSAADGRNFSYQLRKPVGVVGGIVGWNYPLCLAASKAGPALAMGNSLVLKPSEFSSLSAARLAELAVEAGIPGGVFNVVHGVGKTTGAALSQHHDVSLLSFTGSSTTGKQLMVAAGQSNMKRLILECGGKSPYLVFDDCIDDMDFLAADIVARAFANQGALCSSSTRILIQENMLEKLLPAIVAQAEKLVPRDPLDCDTVFGAIINEAHLKKIMAYIESGKREGARLIFGGNKVEANDGDLVKGGYYLEPAIFCNVDPRQKIAREEIFGPVLCIFTFRDESEAISLANDSSYGLAAYAATTSLNRANRLSQCLDAGVIAIIATSMSFPGEVLLGCEPHKQSGLGIEGGMDGMLAYTTRSSVHMLM